MGFLNLSHSMLVQVNRDADDLVYQGILSLAIVVPFQIYVFRMKNRPLDVSIWPELQIHKS
jgi:hypothetical protein